GWAVQAIDGHDTDAIAAALEKAKAEDRPSFIACRTTIAFGAPTKAGSAASHGSPLGAPEIAGARAALDWSHPPFDIPDDVPEAWRAAGRRGAGLYRGWQQRLDSTDAATRAEFARRSEGKLPDAWLTALAALKKKFSSEAPKIATRQASGLVLDA